MSILITFTAEEEAKALSILLRHSPGTILPNRTYLVDESVLPALREAQVRFHEVAPRSKTSLLEEATTGERI